MWHYTTSGTGPPLILLHGLGMSHRVWGPVVPYLNPTRRVIAFDIPGFGATPPLPAGTVPTVANLVDSLRRSIDGLGIEGAVDIAGNSLGGTLALEAAARGIARSSVAISPACLWKAHPPAHVRYVFGTLRVMALHGAGLLKAAMKHSGLREVLLTVPLSAGSARMPADDACGAVDDLAAATAFRETFLHTRTPFSTGPIGVPVTVVYGGRDLILPKGARRRDRLPAHTVWVERPRWGHVPMWVDPAGVAGIILEGTSAAQVSDRPIRRSGI